LVWLWPWRGLLHLLSETRQCSGQCSAASNCVFQAVCSVINLSRWKLAEELSGFFESAVEQDFPDRVGAKSPWLCAGLTVLLSQQVVCCLVTVLRLDLQWSMATLDDSNPSRVRLGVGECAVLCTLLSVQEVMRAIQSKLNLLLRYCRDLLHSTRHPQSREDYITLCDLLIAFGRQLRAVGQLAPLAYCPDPSLQRALQV